MNKLQMVLATVALVIATMPVQADSNLQMRLKAAICMTDGFEKIGIVDRAAQMYVDEKTDAEILAYLGAQTPNFDAWFTRCAITDMQQTRKDVVGELAVTLLLDRIDRRVADKNDE